MGIALLGWAVAAGPSAKGGKLPAPLIKEMTAAVVAVGKALGLESWPSHGIKPCVDRGTQDNPAKEVGREDALKCATGAVDENNFPGLGKQYVLAVLMAPIGPTTVLALGIAEAEGWAAYSCDPGRKCLPVKIDPGTKWGKRVSDRRNKACASGAATIWLPASGRSCPDGQGEAAAAAAAPAPTGPPPPPPPAPPTPARPPEATPPTEKAAPMPPK